MFLSPCFSARLKRPTKEPVPYCKEALEQDLLRVRIAWEECQSSRDRNAIYGYLSAVFDLVMWWAAEDRAISRARWALRLRHFDLPTNRRTVCGCDLVHRRPSKGGQTDAIQVVARAAVRSGVQAGCSVPCRVRPAQGRHQQMCCAVHLLPPAKRW